MVMYNINVKIVLSKIQHGWTTHLASTRKLESD